MFMFIILKKKKPKMTWHNSSISQFHLSFRNIEIVLYIKNIMYLGTFPKEIERERERERERGRERKRERER